MPAPAAVNDEAMYPTATMSVPGREQIATPGAHSASTTSAPLYDGESTTLTHSKGQMPAVHAPRRRRVWPWLLVFALVLAVGGGLTYWSLWRSEQQRPTSTTDQSGRPAVAADSEAQLAPDRPTKEAPAAPADAGPSNTAAPGPTADLAAAPVASRLPDVAADHVRAWMERLIAAAGMVVACGLLAWAFRWRRRRRSSS